MNRERFINAITAHMQQHDHVSAAAQALATIFTEAEAWRLEYDNHFATNALFDLAVADMPNLRLIEWFCFENNYGRGDLKAYDQDNNPIPLTTPGELWDYIVKGGDHAND